LAGALKPTPWLSQRQSFYAKAVFKTKVKAMKRAILNDFLMF